MKTDKDKKYFYQKYNDTKREYELKEIVLGRENWWYVQLDANIRFAFAKYHLRLPKYVVIQSWLNHTDILIYRHDIVNEKELIKWCNNRHALLDELKHQAVANSTEEDREDWIEFRFHVL